MKNLAYYRYSKILVLKHTVQCFKFWEFVANEMLKSSIYEIS